MSRSAILSLLATLSMAASGCAHAQNTPIDDGLMVDAIDHSIDPCEDFYRFACNGWLKANPIPPDQSAWDVGAPLVERNNAALRTILETAANAPDPETRKIGDYWTACMDEQTIERKGISVLQPDLDRIEGLVDKADLAQLIAHLQAIGVDVLFSFGSDQDARDATQEIAEVDQGGLGLPDQSYYTRTDRRSVELRAAYVKHLGRMAVLAGVPEDAAAVSAASVMSLETELAKASLPDEQRLDPRSTYHRLSRMALIKLVPEFNWPAYLTAIGAPDVDSLNVAVPGFFEALRKIVAATDLADLKSYLRAHLLERAAAMLPARFGEESFDFFGKALRGTKEQRPRWKRCVGFVDDDLGEDLGRIYVRNAFGSDAKAAVKSMVDEIKAAFAEDIKSIPWMGTETRDKALNKLDAMAEKIGYPEHWRDYSKLEIRRDDALGNVLRAAAFDLARRLGKIGKPVDRQEWEMTPPTVNAYYDDAKNDINFPAGILQRPYFDRRWDDAINYGSTGVTIGHEMTHGFDDSGRLYDSEGNLRTWWTAKDATSFAKRAQCFVREYGGFTIADGGKVKGDVTLGENTADNGGVRLAYAALVKKLSDQPVEKIDDYTPRQRFFLAFAQSYCENETDAEARLRLQVDPHSPAKARVNGALTNMTEFRETFACHAGQAMAPAKMCRVW